MDNTKQKAVATPKPQYVIEAKSDYDNELKKFAEAKDALVAKRLAWKKANEQFKTEKQTQTAA
jgi:hypothetical protein